MLLFPRFFLNSEGHFISLTPLSVHVHFSFFAILVSCHWKVCTAKFGPLFTQDVYSIITSLVLEAWSPNCQQSCNDSSVYHHHLFLFLNLLITFSNFSFLTEILSREC